MLKIKSLKKNFGSKKVLKGIDLEVNKGDIVGIKGRIQTSSYEAEDGTIRKYTEVVAEKVTFLSSKKNDEDEV